MHKHTLELLSMRTQSNIDIDIRVILEIIVIIILDFINIQIGQVRIKYNSITFAHEFKPR